MGEVERRRQRLYRSGDSFVVSLDPSWLRTHGLDRGGDISIVYRSKSVSIEPPLTLREVLELAASSKNPSDLARKMRDLKDRMRAAAPAGQAKMSHPELNAAFEAALQAAVSGPEALRKAAREWKDRELDRELRRRRHR